MNNEINNTNESIERITYKDAVTRSADIKEENINQLKQLFPDVFTEGKIDFDALKAELGEYIETENERYNFTWNGKTQARQIAQTPSTGTLRPVKEESVNWDTTENIFIEGDNLEVLKLLQKSYHKKIKMIYIDPPYNTGSDFVYKDNFHDNIKNYLEQTGQVDSIGNKLSTNSDTSGRYHSNWLNMMYPRLKLARNLLKDDGVIFISIDDNELVNLKKLCDEIFGNQNFVNLITLKSSEASGVKMAHTEDKLPKIKEYLLIYKKKEISLKPIKVSKVDDIEYLKKYTKYYSKIIINKNQSVDNWEIIPLKDYFKNNNIIIEDEDELLKFKLDHAEAMVYRTNNSTLANLEFKSKTAKVISPTGIEYIWWEGKQMLFLSDYLQGSLCDLWTDISTINLNKEMAGLPALFKNGQKPLKLIERCIDLVCSSSDIVLDFFAGSGTTAHAVMNFNLKNHSNLKFICIQIPEITAEGSDARNAEYYYISDLTKDRIKKASMLLKTESTDSVIDFGVKTFKLDETNLKSWDPNTLDLQQSLLDSTYSIKQNRTNEDVLYEIIVKYGLALTTKIKAVNLLDKEIFFLGAGSVVVCIDDNITQELIDEMGLYIQKNYSYLQSDDEQDTTKENKIAIQVIFKDAGFVNSIVKANVINNLKKLGITDVKSI